MSSRSLNKVILIGNLTRDPELRFTPTGTAVCTFGLATNRSWTTDSGEKREETEFHRIVSWNKLAELCSQLLAKGRKVYVEGRLQTRNWNGSDGAQHTTTEVVIEDMIILDSKRVGDPNQAGVSATFANPAHVVSDSASSQTPPSNDSTSMKTDSKKEETKKEEIAAAANNSVSEEINPDDIPF
jgi:single-strand DNA-binding protein